MLEFRKITMHTGALQSFEELLYRYTTQLTCQSCASIELLRSKPVLIFDNNNNNVNNNFI